MRDLIERRNLFTGPEVRMEGEGETRKIRGYAAVFYKEGDPATQYQLWPGAVERIMPGTFDRALSEKDDVRGLFNHAVSKLLGRTASDTMQLGVDAVGLWYEIDPGDTTVARDLAIHLERKDVTGSSLSMRVGIENQKWTVEKITDDVEIEIRTITGTDKLVDVGPVTFPAYTGTEAAIRSADDPAREAHDAWAKKNQSRSVAQRRHQLRKLKAHP